MHVGIGVAGQRAHAGVRRGAQVSEGDQVFGRLQHTAERTRLRPPRNGQSGDQCARLSSVG